MNTVKLTENQKLLLNALFSMLGGAVIGATQSTYQYLTQQGTINISQALAFAVGSFWALFSAALFAYIPPHAQQLLSATEDTGKEIGQALGVVSPVQPAIQQPPVAASQSQPGPLVVIHAASTPALTTTTIATPTVTPTIANSAAPVTLTIVPSTTPAVSSATSVEPIADMGPIATTPDLSSEDTATRAAIKVTQ